MMESKSSIFLTRNLRNELDNMAPVRPSGFNKINPFFESTIISRHPSSSSSSSNFVSHYVINLLSIYYWSCMIPDRISYDAEKRQCIKIRGSFLRRIISAIINFLVILNLLRGALFSFGSFNTAIAVLYKIMYTVFVLFACSLFHFGWTKIDKTAQLLNEIINISNYMGSFGAPTKCKNSEKIVIYVSIAVSTIYAVLFALVSLGYNALWESILFASENGWQDFGEIVYQNISKRTAFVAIETFCLYTGQTPPTSSLDSFSKPIIILLGLMQQILNLYNSCFWVYSYCTLFLWALLFGKLFQIFVIKVKMCRMVKENVLQDIQDFNRLSISLDSFNSIYGLITLFATFSGIMNGATTAANEILYASTGNGFQRVVSLGAMIPLLIFLMAGSRVNHLANEYGTLLKEQYTNRIWTKQQAEISHGMAIVFHEIQTNSVGMQGAGFFTISHNFIGTVIGLVATYAVVILQWGAVDGNKKQ